MITPALVRRCARTLLALLAIARLEGATVVMDQIGDASNYQTLLSQSPAGSQIYSDFPSSDSMALDDFSILGSGKTVTSVSALFLAGGGFEAFEDVTGYRLSIFSTATLAGVSLHGDIADLFVIPGANVLVTRINDSDLAEVTLFVDVTLPAEGVYWVALAPVSAYAVTGSFTLLNNGAQGQISPGNANGQFANPGLGHGLEALNATNLDFAYRVKATPEPSAAMMLLSPAVMCLVLRKRPKRSSHA